MEVVVHDSLRAAIADPSQDFNLVLDERLTLRHDKFRAMTKPRIRLQVPILRKRGERPSPTAGAGSDASALDMRADQAVELR